jgi:hypothetical protein
VGIADRLNHVVHLERDETTGTEDDYGHAVTAPATGEDFRANIQPKSAREVALLSQAGAAIGDWTIFTLPRLIVPADKVIHDSSTCPVAEAADLPDATFELTGVRNAAGLGHHLEIDARLVGSPTAVAGS